MLTPRLLWTAMPQAARETLLLAAHGGRRLTAVIGHILDHNADWAGLPPADLCALLNGLAVAAWEDAPFDPQICSLLVQLHQQNQPLPPPLLRAAAQGARLPEDCGDLVQRLDNLSGSESVERTRAQVERYAKQRPDALLPLFFAVRAGLKAGDPDWFAAYCRLLRLPPLLRRGLEADTLYARGDWANAALAYDKALALCPLPGLLARKAQCLYQQEESQAVDLFRQAAALAPWDTGLLLRAADLQAGRDRPTAPPPGKGAVLLYSWNHAQDLEETLAALLASDLGEARVLLLDNGSTDETAAVAARMTANFAGRLRALRLPVNVGAPAARNWLLQEPEAAQADWVVYLDDDALVPPHWLRALGTAAAAFPDAGILGCQVTDMGAHMAVQSTDLHFESDLFIRQDANKSGLFNLTDLCSPLPDFGYFQYIRPCLSVTGCCHLLRRSSLDAVGGFDLQFSPSQFDDLERDLRAGLKGENVVYNGHLRIQHKKRSGLMCRVNHRQAVNALGNSTKLRGLYAEDEIRRLRDADFKRLFAGLLQAAKQLCAPTP